MNRPLTPRRPGRRQWSGFWQCCPLCGETMDMVLDGGRQAYECPDCLRGFAVQLKLFAGAA